MTNKLHQLQEEAREKLNLFIINHDIDDELEGYNIHTFLDSMIQETVQKVCESLVIEERKGTIDDTIGNISIGHISPIDELGWNAASQELLKKMEEWKV